MRRYLAVLAVALVVLSPLFSYIASGDGTPITVLHGYSGLRENFQLAYIDAKGNSERMHLFLSVASLNPGEELTILVPLRTHPSHISLEKMNNSYFRHEYGFSEIHDLHIKQTNGTEKFGSDMRGMLPYVLTAEIGSVAAMAYLFVGVSSSEGISSSEHYETYGLSVDVYSFNSSDSLSAFYSSMNAPVPQNVAEVIARYGNFSVAAVRTVTRPPIPQNEYDALEAYVPDVMDDFRDFVSENDEIYIFKDSYKLGPSSIADMQSRVYEKCEEMNYSFDLMDYFRDLVFATYGIGHMEGFEISMSLPLYEGKAFFPLGTSPAWGKVGTTEIMFSCPDSYSLSFDRPMEEAFSSGKHYYLWKSENSAPDYDLEGKLTYSEDTWKPISWTLNGVLYDFSPIFSFLIYLSAIALIWMPIELFVEGKSPREMNRRDILLLISRSYIFAIASLILSFFIALVVALAGPLHYWRKKVELSELIPEFRIAYYLFILAPLLFISFFILSIFVFIYRNNSIVLTLFSTVFVLYFGALMLSHVLAYKGMKTEEYTYRENRIWILTGISASVLSIFLYPLLIFNPLAYGTWCGLGILLFVLFLLPLITASAVLRNVFRDIASES